MPTYCFKNLDTEQIVERTLPLVLAAKLENLSDPKIIEQYRTLGLVSESGRPFERILPRDTNIVLKGEQFPGKRVKIRGQMNKRKRRARRKGFRDLPDPTKLGLVPNVEGDEYPTWEAAKEAATKKGYTQEQLATFDTAIRQRRELEEQHVRDYEDVR